MRSLKYLLGLVLALCTFLFFQSSCKKEHDSTIYTVSGHLYVDTNHQPIAGVKLRLFQNFNNVMWGHQNVGGELMTTTTDSTGSFEFNFKDNDGLDYIIQMELGGSFMDVMVNIPQRRNTKDLVLYRTPSVNVQVSLNVLNPHTSQDTLSVGNVETLLGYLKFPGPFTSKVLYTAKDYLVKPMYYDGESKQLIYFLIPSIPIYKPFIINNYCSSDTIKIVLDI